MTTRRKLALACIAADVAENGKLTQTGIRAYIESHISRAALNEAMRAGQAIYNRAHGIEPRTGFWTKS